jgi:hypothetical protein
MSGAMYTTTRFKASHLHNTWAVANGNAETSNAKTFHEYHAAYLVQGEKEHEHVVGRALSETVQPVEGVTRERRGHQPLHYKSIDV